MIDFEWVVLAGGFGTRSSNPNVPKILQKVGDVKIIDFLINCLISSGSQKVTFVLSHGAQEVIDYLERRALNLDWRVHFDEGAGPVLALKAAALEITSSNIGCILGDTVIDAPLERFRRSHIQSGMAASCVVKQSTHIQDSDAFILDHLGNTVEFKPKGSEFRNPEGHIWGSSGILFMKTGLAVQLDESQRDIASSLAARLRPSEINCIRSSFYHKDSGTHGRLEGIRNDFNSGLLNREGAIATHRRALFVDRDGTVCLDLPSGRSDIEASELSLKAVQAIRLAKIHGIPVFLVTNQPAIAKGFILFRDVYKVHNNLQRILLGMSGVLFDDLAFCPHHPESGHAGEVRELKIKCHCRKPNIGMFTNLARDHSIDLEQSVLLGDSEADEGAARIGGMMFVNVEQYQDQLLLDRWGLK